MLRLLTSDDIPAAKAIAMLKSRHSGTESTPEETIDALLHNLTQEQDKVKIVGYFDSGDLVSWLAIRFGTLHEEKVWVILHLFTRVFRNHFSWSHPELGLLVAWAFGLAESRGHYTYLYSIATRLERVYEYQWRKNPWLPPRGRYVKEVVTRVPRNTEADAWMNRLAGLPKPDDISILKRSLRPECRNDSVNPSEAPPSEGRDGALRLPVEEARRLPD